MRAIESFLWRASLHALISKAISNEIHYAATESVVQIEQSNSGPPRYARTQVLVSKITSTEQAHIAIESVAQTVQSEAISQRCTSINVLISKVSFSEHLTTPLS